MKGGRCYDMAGSKAGWWITATKDGIMYGNLKTKWQGLAMLRIKGNLVPNQGLCEIEYHKTR